MLNTEVNVDIKPACTGMMQKSHPTSYFKWCKVHSPYADNYVDENPRVLQVMVFGDNNMLVEFLPKDVYDEWLKESDNG